MRIFDLTSGLKIGDHNNWVFNNSIVHYKKNLFLCAYRNIIYDIPVQIHPWNFWFNSHKLIQKHRPDLIEKNSHLGDNRKLFIESKYRDRLDSDLFIKLYKKKDNIDHIEGVEFDGTGFAILEFKGNRFKVIANVNNIFGSSMNHDTRIYNYDGNLYMTYNGFFHRNKMEVVMLKRKFEIEEDFLYLHPEEYLLKRSGTVEKNCIILHNGDILYKISQELTIEKENGEHILKPHPFRIFERSYLSLSTPVVRWNEDEYITCGHMKIEYEGNVYAEKFLESVDISNIKMHGKFIYFAFFFTFDRGYNITGFSDYFIPENYTPYLLAFPTGLTRLGDKLYMSYGEGDERAKVLEIDVKEISGIMKDKNQLMTILTEDYIKPKVCHIGYFGFWNCGDDAFMKCFRYLSRNGQYNIVGKDEGFINVLKVLGGGDVINDYFCKDEADVAFGVGIPYMSKVTLLDKFGRVVLRNRRDYELLKERENVSYIPDIAWLLPKFYTPKDLCLEGKKLGISIPRTYFNRNYVKEYKELVVEISKLLHLLTPTCTIYLIPFGINDENIKEDDNIIMRHIHELVPETIHCAVEREEDYVENIIDIVNSMDLMICGRYHSHIFSAICDIPFVSLSCSRKCRELMTEFRLEKYFYGFNTNEADIPVNFDHRAFYDWFRNIDLNKLEADVNATHSQYSRMSSTIEETWDEIVSKL